MVPSVLSSRAMAAYEALLPRHHESTLGGVRRSWSDFHNAGRPVCRSLQPLFIDRSFNDAIARQATLIARAFDVALAHMAPRLGLSPRMTELLKIALARPTVAVTRLDGFPRGDSLVFLESNSMGQVTMPAGLGDGDVLRDLFLDLPIMKALQESFTVRRQSTTTLAVEAVIEAHRTRGLDTVPDIAVVDARSDPASAYGPPGAEERERLRLIQHTLARGCKVRFCAPADLHFADGRLRLGGAPIDMVFIGDASGTYLATCPDDDPMLMAFRAGVLTLGDGYPLSLLAHDKKIFAYLTDPEAGVPLDDEMARTVSACLPWTRICRDGRTSFAGRVVDLRPFAIAQREQLAIKPSRAFGGKDVVLGWRVGSEDWALAVEQAFRSGDHIVQERVAGTTVRLPILDDEGVERGRDVYFDLNPYVWMASRADGWWARISSTDLLNVTLGAGSEVPVFVVDDGPK